MNLSSFLEHWAIAENPFRAEEARHDPVFSRLGSNRSRHPDFEKILGDLFRPSTSIVFGEKGSGKTAIRMQIAERIREFNEENPNDRVLLVAYDDLNPVLDRLVQRIAPSNDSSEKSISRALDKLRLVDHMDAILAAAVPLVVDGLLGRGSATTEGGTTVRPEPTSLRSLRRTDPGIRRDLCLLQAVYDREEDAHLRARSLRRRIGAPANRNRMLWKALALFGWLPAAGIAALSFVYTDVFGPKVWLYGFLAVLALWGLVLIKFLLWDRWRAILLAKRINRQVLTARRSVDSWADALQMLAPTERAPALLPLGELDEPRYAMFARLRAALSAIGYKGIIIVVDRIDEPTLVNGDPDRMRAVIWPMFNNKFLQQDGIGLKLLLPIELRHELFRESTAFFQEARLDKQSLIERLMWTGPMLYDLCNARLGACRSPGSEPISLTDLFEPDVSRQDLVDALDQMHQPRDAFKLLYRCMQEHCSNVTDEQPKWRIPKLTLDTVRKQESDRVQMFYRGVRPA